jgi:hypothetical protein
MVFEIRTLTLTQLQILPYRTGKKDILFHTWNMIKTKVKRIGCKEACFNEAEGLEILATNKRRVKE